MPSLNGMASVLKPSSCYCLPRHQCRSIFFKKSAAEPWVDFKIWFYIRLPYAQGKVVLALSSVVMNLPLVL